MTEPTTEPTVVPHPALAQAAKEASAAERGQTNSIPEHRPGDTVASAAEQRAEPKAPSSRADSGKSFSLKARSLIDNSPMRCS